MRFWRLALSRAATVLVLILVLILKTGHGRCSPGDRTRGSTSRVTLQETAVEHEHEHEHDWGEGTNGALCNRNSQIQ